MNAPAQRSDAELRPSLAGRRLGRYEILTQIASGGMAGVYIARAMGVAGFERLVAVKVLHPHLAHEEEFITMFLDEARLAARIRHPNVVPTLDISDTEGAGYFLVMDYIEGDHLGALLRSAARKRERLPQPVVLRAILDALAGLDAAHRLTGEDGRPLNLVHRDISPHNIMVGRDGVARLTDFGVAKAEVRLSSTREGQFKGKLGYMAPEHASTGDADQRSDLFSMAIVFWECLAGKRLFRGDNNAATLNKILIEPIPRISDVVPSAAPFDRVLEKALDRDPIGRFQSADEFMVAIEEAARTGPGIATARAVSEVVVEHVGDKLKEEADRIKQAIATFGQAGIGEAPLPLPGDGSGSGASGVRTGTSQPSFPSQAGEDATVGARPSQRIPLPDPPLGAPPERGGNTWLLWLAVAAVLVGVAGLALGVGMSGEDEEPPTIEIIDTSSPTAEPATGTAEPPEEAEPAAELAAPEAEEPGGDPTAEATEIGTEEDEAEPTEAETAPEDPRAEARARARRERIARQRAAMAALEAGAMDSMATGMEEAGAMTSDIEVPRANPYRR